MSDIAFKPAMTMTWPIAWSTLIEPDVWLPNSPALNPVDYAVWGFYHGWFINVDESRQFWSTEWDKLSQRLVDRAIGQWRRRLESIVQQHGGHIGWCENCEMLQLLWTITEAINRLFSAVNFLECVLTDIALFSIIALTTLIFHLRCGGTFSDNVTTICFWFQQ